MKRRMSEISYNPGHKAAEIESATTALRKEVFLRRILGKSRGIKEIFRKIDLISSCDGSPSVLISGESGTGKELVASTIHYLSNRRRKPFIPINCSALPESLFESELFGHLKGAFTGAGVSRSGLVEEVHGGTLFLDEIGTVPPSIQVKFLRLLQEGEYKPLGDSRIHRADVRVIAATNKNLMQCIRDGTFREDLYYRLSTIPLHIPPLRERKEDIPLLVSHFIKQYSNQYRKGAKELSEDAIEYLIAYQWPGNVRELENIIQQLVILCPASTITSSDVISLLKKENWGAEDSHFESMKDAKKIHERTYLTNLLQHCNGNVACAAKRAGVSRTALWNHIRKHDIAPNNFRHQK